MEKLRIAYIDQIKVFLTCLVVAHHAGQAYGNTGGVWLVDDPAKAEFLRSFFFLNASYMMGLYFFISGYFMFFSFTRKPSTTFLLDRFKRLGIPLGVISMGVLLPLNYIGSSSDENIVVFFVESYIDNPPMGVGHLWFVACLLLFTLIYIILYSLLSRLKVNVPISLKSYSPILYIFSLSVVGYFVRLVYPIDHWETWLVPMEVAHLPQYFSLFILGAIFNSKNWLDQITTRLGVSYLFAAMLVFVIYKFDFLPLEGLFIETLVECILCVGISMGVIVLFKKFANTMTGFSKYLSDNSYGIYILHLFVVILIQKLMLDLPMNGTIKFLIVSVFGTLFSLAISHVIRKNKMVREII
jgi:peptidoglycan/LPS O-acetylase OafA/YrhL